MQVDKLIEIRSTQINDIWYEVHIDATEQRYIMEVYPERGEVTDEILNQLIDEVDKIDNI
jgi:hypothetical protein